MGGVAVGLTAAALLGALVTAMLAMPQEAAGLSPDVASELERSGAENPVTAVLLNFRGYDTLLELTVLLLAVLGARVLAAPAADDLLRRVAPSRSPILLGFLHVVGPAMIVVAAYLLWVGAKAPGGAFQAGVVLAALGVLLLLAGIDWTRHLSDGPERWLVVAGLVAFLAVGVGAMAQGRRFLEYHPETAKAWILLIESAATISIATVLAALFCGGHLSTAMSAPSQSRERSP